MSTPTVQGSGQHLPQNTEQQQVQQQTPHQISQDSLEIGAGCEKMATGIIEGILSAFCLSNLISTGGIGWFLGSMCCFPSAMKDFFGGLYHIVTASFSNRNAQNNTENSNQP